MAETEIARKGRLKIAILSLVLTLLCSCSPNKNDRKYCVRIKANSGDWDSSILDCDSFMMKSATEIDIWMDGSKSTVIASEIAPYCPRIGR